MSDELPANSQEWEECSGQHKSVHDLELIDSASKIQITQFYALQILWQPQDRFPSKLMLCDEANLQQARDFLDESVAWKSYLENIEKNAGSVSLATIEDIGAFSLVRYNQTRAYLSPLAQPEPKRVNDDDNSTLRKVVPSPVSHRTRSSKLSSATPDTPDTPTPKSRVQREEKHASWVDSPGSLSHLSLYETPQGSYNDVTPSAQSPGYAVETFRSEDELIVNTALILFLDSLTIYHPKVKKGGNKSPRWTIKPQRFVFGKWEARTDGLLRVAGDKHETRAILETKPYPRAKNLVGIQKQEGAQMAAWIHQYPEDGVSVSGKKVSCFRRFLIFQDCFEIYLTIAEYNSDYKDYIVGNNSNTIINLSFMTMKQYGPWDTREYKHMAHLGPLLLALTLEQFNHISPQEDPFRGHGTHKP